MEKRRRVTEEDLRMTEEMIAKSYGRLKRSVAQAPSHALGAVSDMVKRRPLITGAALVGAGLIAYGLLKLVTPRSKGREEGTRPNLANQILSFLLPLVAPLLVGHIKQYLGSILSGKRD